MRSATVLHERDEPGDVATLDVTTECRAQPGQAWGREWGGRPGARPSQSWLRTRRRESRAMHGMILAERADQPSTGLAFATARTMSVVEMTPTT